MLLFGARDEGGASREQGYTEITVSRMTLRPDRLLSRPA
jgi:hypothetical protein